MDEEQGASPENPSNSDPPAILPYFSGSQQNLVRLRRIGSMEAQLAHAKLESEGIHCFIAGENTNVAYPLLFNSVELQVLESDVGRANEILDRPADIDAEGEYADEEYRCPRCHRKAVDLLPVSKGIRRLRLGWLGLLLLPILLAAVEWALVDPELIKRLDRFVSTFELPWFLLLIVFTLIMLLGKRKKRCSDCGWEWWLGDSTTENLGT
jgi:Putative prokaryotic signal transducing protein